MSRRRESIAAAARRRGCVRPLRGSLAALTALLVATTAIAADGPPNIVLIIGDDVGWQDYGFMGSEIVKTPNLDRLAASGAVYTHAFTTDSVCKPAMRTLLTGLYPELVERRQRRYVEKKGRPARIRDLFETLPEKLAERGYASFQGGKYWEGSFEDGGFTHGTMLETLTWASESEGLELGRETMKPLFDFLDEQKDGPFFVWYAPMLPHMPFDAPAEFTQLYASQPGSALARGYWANMTRFDASVGALLERLDELGLRDETLVLYLADNGWDSQGPQTMVGGDKGKTSVYEIGFRTPLVASWPGHIEAGARSDAIVSFVDVYPTILDFAGSAAGGKPGKSLRPALSGEGEFDRKIAFGGTGPPLRREWFLRTKTWRFVQREDGTESLYLIERDTREDDDLAAKHPELVRALGAELDVRLRDIGVGKIARSRARSKGRAQ